MLSPDEYVCFRVRLKANQKVTVAKDPSSEVGHSNEAISELTTFIKVASRECCLLFFASCILDSTVRVNVFADMSES